MAARAFATPRLSRKEWALVALGVLAWIAIGIAGTWFVHQVTRPRGDCGTPSDAPTHPVKTAAAGPNNAFQAITGQGRCQ